MKENNVIKCVNITFYKMIHLQLQDEEDLIEFIPLLYAFGLMVL